MFAAALTTKVLFSIINNTLYLFAGDTSVDKVYSLLRNRKFNILRVLYFNSSKYLNICTSR